MTSQADSAAARRMWVRGRLPVAAALGLSMAVPGPALNAGERSALLGVTVTVPAIARMQVVSQARELQVSSQDLARGFVDVSEPMQLSVYSNAAAGYTLEVLPLIPLVSSIEVHGLSGQARLGPGGGRIVQRWSGPQTATLKLTFRLGLASGARPGTYPWPLHLDVQPIDASL